MSCIRWKEINLKTFKEKPRSAEIPSHILLLRGGYLRQLHQGIFNYNPLILRAIKKFEHIVREEMERSQSREILLPMVHPKEVWEETERWVQFDDLLQKMTGRSKQEFCLGPTHEEVIIDFVRSNVKSYRDLPFNLYQIQTKYRNEIRPRFGLLRAREFIMKDAYSFDKDPQESKRSYRTMRQAYQNIFKRLGVNFVIVHADTGNIGGKTSEEFQILADHGEDTLLVSDSGSFASNVEVCSQKAGDKSPDGEGILVEKKGIEVGHLFYLSDTYSKLMNLSYFDSQGVSHFVEMGCYGIGITRTIQAIIEQRCDSNGFSWPPSISPCLFHLSLLDPSKNTKRREGDFRDL